MATAITRHFLGWERPLCETVPAWLLVNNAAMTVDLRGTVVVTPTRQASWRLRAALPLAACPRQILGPEIVTAPALLTPPPSPKRSSDLQNLLAWCAVLKAVPVGELHAFLGSQHPSTTPWTLQVGRRLSALREELADGAQSIAQVAAQETELDEPERWADMAELERRFLRQLDAWSLEDGISSALAKAQKGLLPPEITRVVMAAMPDPPRLLTTLLEAWSRNGGCVDVLIAAPQTESDVFDAWGRPIPEKWNASGKTIDCEDSDLFLAANPEDQAACIATLLQDTPHTASHQQTYRPSIAIGVPDTETIAPLQRELAAIGLPAFDPRNKLFSDTPLFRLVQALLVWQTRPGYAETAALLRHPDVLSALTNPDAALRELDLLQTRHLPVSFDDLKQRVAQSISSPHEMSFLHEALNRLSAWHTSLSQSSLAAGLRATLQDIYASRSLITGQPGDDFFRAAASTLDESLRELADAESSGQSASDAATVLLARLQSASIKPERTDEPLDLEGWLELAWNPASLLLVAGMNEGFVPDSRMSDLFLPDALRAKINLRDDRTRLARDAYLLTALLAQRRTQGRTILITGKTSTAGDPLRPSRLLFRCSNAQLVARAQKLFSQPPARHTAAVFSTSFLLDPARIPPESIRTRLPNVMSPTLFRDYLDCPLHFWLKHVLKMESCDDRTREPDARAFGDLCHAALEEMGACRIWACGDEQKLANWLEECVREKARLRYGAQPWLGVTLAVESAVRRLRVFAARQIAWYAQGWEIVATEQSDWSCTFDGVAIRGRIDRIDRHRDGRLCVLDYKTTDEAKQPEQAHIASLNREDVVPESVIQDTTLLQSGKRTGGKPKRWIDLQLPLYREMASIRHGPDLSLAYVLLPKTPGEIAFALWEGYSPALHDHAMTCAKAVLARIRAEQFWPPASRMPPFSDYVDLLGDDPEHRILPPHASLSNRGRTP